jgi:SpoVK/Ycf46/Vps4 family AAA+-type ATPase
MSKQIREKPESSAKQKVARWLEHPLALRGLMWIGTPLVICGLVALVSRIMDSENYEILAASDVWALVYFAVIGIMIRFKKEQPSANLGAPIGGLYVLWFVIFIQAWAFETLPEGIAEGDTFLYPWTFHAVKHYVWGWQVIFVLAGAGFFHYIGLQRQQVANVEVKAAPTDREIVLEAALARLDAMIGLEDIKYEINQLMKQLVGQQKIARVAHVKKPTLHMVFSGPPGTGKTEIARIMADLLYGMGYLDQNKLIECDRSQIIGSYIGQTEAKMSALIEEALGGILFIDEAYTLAKEGQDFGQEAVEVLLKAMEDKRDQFVVILAGYQADMNRLLAMNEGFKSRIPHHFVFRNYHADELADLASVMLSSESYDISLASEELYQVIVDQVKTGQVKGNARWVRHFVERITREHAVRLASEEGEEGVISADDVSRAAGAHRSSYGNANEQLKQEAMNQLDGLIGLNTLKEEVRNFLTLVEVEQEREQAGIKTPKLAMHMKFLGPPGTGKTTVARIMGQFLYATGFLTTGNFVEADRSSIIGKYVGHTEANMKRLIEQAEGGVLFIDEAYSLVKEGNDFGSEAVAVLLKAMEDKRENLIVILAGYEEEMEELMRSNSGFTSRIPFTFQFPSYSPSEMYRIVLKLLADQYFNLDIETMHTLERALLAKGEFNGNGRWGREFVGKIRLAQVKRLRESGSSRLQEITDSDILEAISKVG